MTTNSLLGLHHVTLVASNAQRTADFYTRVLGLRLIKTTVNFDDPGSYHLYEFIQKVVPDSLQYYLDDTGIASLNSPSGMLRDSNLRAA